MIIYTVNPEPYIFWFWPALHIRPMPPAAYAPHEAPFMNRCSVARICVDQKGIASRALLQVFSYHHRHRLSVPDVWQPSTAVDVFGAVHQRCCSSKPAWRAGNERCVCVHVLAFSARWSGLLTMLQQQVGLKSKRWKVCVRVHVFALVAF